MRTTPIYFVGEAGEGVTITAKVGCDNNVVAVQTATFTAPALLGATVYVKIGGVWKPAQVKVKVGGAWKDSLAKIKVGGTWK